MFRRDDIDVLEDELDDLFATHDALPDGEQFDMEEALIREQIDTEEAFENELAELLGAPLVVHTEHHVCGPNCDDLQQDISIRDLLKRDAEQDPLYRRARDWSRQVAAWARDRYLLERSPDVFRSLINAHLVPVKIAFAQTELEREDEFSRPLGEKEYQLAGTYLLRVAESLNACRKKDVQDRVLETLIEEAGTLASEITHRRRHLGTKNT